jgi:DNA-binding transcriptional LysR family regulator
MFSLLRSCGVGCEFSTPKEEDVWAVYPHRRHVPLKVKLAIEHMQHEFQSRPPMLTTHLSA